MIEKLEQIIEKLKKLELSDKQLYDIRRYIYNLWYVVEIIEKEQKKHETES
jgi:hypothetical protein